ncbi:MAG: hypoxanthine phosphoribosyltransferase [Desulfovibrionaceae bacterium]|nr:hypoxanthine phosphoribosyltransferase [Desulfovibrionaceae bacterium]
MNGVGKPGRTLFSREAIASRVVELAEEINGVYAGQRLVVICVLKGAFIFFSDLVRQIRLETCLDFVRIASYGRKKDRDGRIFFTKDVELSLNGEHVLVVEDIVDTGHSMDFLFKQLAARGAASLRLAALVDKSERRERSVVVDWAGFSITSGFIVGYGLDYAEKYRELPDIRLLELE